MNELGDVIRKAMESISTGMGPGMEEFAKERIHGEAGAGLVKVEVTGTGTVVSVEIDPMLMDRDHRVHVQQLLIGAMNDAHERQKKRLAELGAEKMANLDINFADLFGRKNEG